MPVIEPSPVPPLVASDPTSGTSGRAASSAWGLWSAVGWVLLLAAAALALATGTGALGEALDLGRWFRR